MESLEVAAMLGETLPLRGPHLDIRQLIRVPHSEAARVAPLDGRGETVSTRSRPSARPSSRPPKRIKPLEARANARKPLPVDAHGHTKLPVTVGAVTIVSLGHVVADRPAYWNSRYIYTPGFESRRLFASPTRKDAKVRPCPCAASPHVPPQCMYASRILDGGAAPTFEVECLEDRPVGHPPLVWRASTPSGAWAPAIRQCNELGQAVRAHS